VLSVRADLLAMPDNRTPSRCDFTSEALSNALQALRVARHQVRLAQPHAPSWRLEDALAEVEDDLNAGLARIQAASADDDAEAEESGEVERVRRAWHPLAA
jgi:hypothetical protein